MGSLCVCRLTSLLERPLKFCSSSVAAWDLEGLKPSSCSWKPHVCSSLQPGPCLPPPWLGALSFQDTAAHTESCCSPPSLSIWTDSSHLFFSSFPTSFGAEEDRSSVSGQRASLGRGLGATPTARSPRSAVGCQAVRGKAMAAAMGCRAGCPPRDASACRSQALLAGWHRC